MKAVLVNFIQKVKKLKFNFKKFILGSKEKNGLVRLLTYYAILVGIGFLFLYPVLYMIINSIKTPEDLVDPAISWVPTTLYFGNFVKAFKTLDFLNSFKNSILMALIPALLQTASSAMIGYGLARFEFPLKKFWMVLVLATFVIPNQVTMIPKYIMFYKYGMINTPLTSIIPTLLGQGLKNAIFIVIFYQFFRSYPKSLDEAAEIDGAGKLKVFLQIAIPMSIPAIVISVLFSFVWYWNETIQSGLFFGTVIKTLPMKLGSFADSYKQIFSSSKEAGANPFSAINESICLAGTFLSILPLLITYFVLQKQFVESVEKSGITGE
jgi:multiple sugar transport system permease protein